MSTWCGIVRCPRDAHRVSAGGTSSPLEAMFADLSTLSEINAARQPLAGPALLLWKSHASLRPAAAALRPPPGQAAGDVPSV